MPAALPQRINQQNVRNKEEKEVLEHFSGVVSLFSQKLTSHSFKRAFKHIFDIANLFITIIGSIICFFLLMRLIFDNCNILVVLDILCQFSAVKVAESIKKLECFVAERAKL